MNQYGMWKWLLRLMGFSLGMVLWLGLNAQSENPFELVPRLPEPVAEEEAKVDEPKNPFDIVSPPGGQRAARNRRNEEAVVPVIETPETPEALEGPFRRFLFGLFFALFLFLAVNVTLFRGFLQKTYRSFFNDNMLSQVHREQGAIVQLPYLALYLFALVNFALSIFLLTRFFEIEILGESVWYQYGVILLGVLAVFIGKHLLLKILGWVFPIGKVLRVYSFSIVVFSIVLGLALFPLNLLFGYGPDGLQGFWVYSILGVVGIVYAFRTVRGVFTAGSYLAMHKFHFLLYICTVEIAPLMLLIKGLMTFGEGI
jgi:hypothetical protein